VHDDVMDEAEIRRSRPDSGCKIGGNEIAVLFGDCLFAQALKLAASFSNPRKSAGPWPWPQIRSVPGRFFQTPPSPGFSSSRGEKYFKVLEMKNR